MWSKKDSDGHLTQAQLDAYEEETYVPPKGYELYGLWNPETNEVATTSMSANETTEEMFEQQKRRMLASVRSTPRKKRKEPTSEEEGSAESVHSSLTVDLSLDPEDGGEEEEAQVKDIPIEEEEDLEKLRSLKAQPESERPARSESNKPALEEKKVEEKEEKRCPLEPTSKAIAKPKPEPKQKASGFTQGGYSIMAQQLIQQKTEQLEHMRETYNYLTETHPAKASLGETIREVEAAIENIKKQQAKTRPKAKAYSSRQEADKKAAGSRVAYIKERQRKRAVEHRLKTRKERAKANVARQEEAERRFNRPKYGQKDKVFPLAEGELAKERQAAPMHRRERTFIKDDDEEMPEIKQRKMEVPPSEKERIKRKRKEENEESKKRSSWPS